MFSGSTQFVSKTNEYNVVFIDPCGAIIIGVYILISWWHTGWREYTCSLLNYEGTEYLFRYALLAILAIHVLCSLHTKKMHSFDKNGNTLQLV